MAVRLLLLPPLLLLLLLSDTGVVDAGCQWHSGLTNPPKKCGKDGCGTGNYGCGVPWRICLKGWGGVKGKGVEDTCYQSVCVPGGISCDEGVRGVCKVSEYFNNQYQCLCKPGFTASYVDSKVGEFLDCATNIDDCSQPDYSTLLCSGLGTCKDAGGDRAKEFTCTCKKGYKAVAKTVTKTNGGAACKCAGYEIDGRGGSDCKSTTTSFGGGSDPFCYTLPYVCPDSRMSSSKTLHFSSVACNPVLETITGQDCETCADGHYQDKAGQSECKSCKVWSDQNCKNFKKLGVCPKTGPATDLSDCTACVDGYYKSTSGECRPKKGYGVSVDDAERPRCVCSGATNTNSTETDRGGAHCTSTTGSPARPFCYTDAGACTDGKGSRFVPDAESSYIACNALAQMACADKDALVRGPAKNPLCCKSDPGMERCLECQGQTSSNRGSCKENKCKTGYAGTKCSDCSDGYLKQQDVCREKGKDGADCDPDNAGECATGRCPGNNAGGSNHCCSIHVNTNQGLPFSTDKCMQCNANGECAVCEDGQFFTGPFCKDKVLALAGKECEDGSFCESGVCLGSFNSGTGKMTKHCCTGETNTSLCTACSTDGRCTACKDSFTVDKNDRTCKHDCPSTTDPNEMTKHGEWEQLNGPYGRKQYAARYVAGNAQCDDADNFEIQGTRKCEDGRLTECKLLGGRMDCTLSKYKFDSCKRGCGTFKIGESEHQVRFREPSVKPGARCQPQYQRRRCERTDDFGDWEVVALESTGTNTSDTPPDNATFVVESCAQRCADNCSSEALSNNVCDKACNNRDCRFDGGFCAQLAQATFDEADFSGIPEVRIDASTTRQRFEDLCAVHRREWGFEKGTLSYSNGKAWTDSDSGDTYTDELQSTITQEACRRAKAMRDGTSVLEVHANWLSPLTMGDHETNARNYITELKSQEQAEEREKDADAASRRYDMMSNSLALIAANVSNLDLSMKAYDTQSADGLAHINALIKNLGSRQRDDFEQAKNSFDEVLVGQQQQQFTMDTAVRAIQADNKAMGDRLEKKMEDTADDFLGKVTDQLEAVTQTIQNSVQSATDSILKKVDVLSDDMVAQFNKVGVKLDDLSNGQTAIYEKEVENGKMIKEIKASLDEQNAKLKGKQAELNAHRRQADDSKAALLVFKTDGMKYFRTFQPGGVGFDLNGNGLVDPIEALDLIRDIVGIQSNDDNLDLDEALAFLLETCRTLFADSPTQAGIEGKDLVEQLSADSEHFFKFKTLLATFGGSDREAFIATLDSDSDNVVTFDDVLEQYVKRDFFRETETFIAPYLKHRKEVRKSAASITGRIRVIILLQSGRVRRDVDSDSIVDILKADVAARSSTLDTAVSSPKSSSFWSSIASDTQSWAGKTSGKVEAADQYLKALEKKISTVSWDGTKEKLEGYARSLGGSAFGDKFANLVDGAMSAFGKARFEDIQKRLTGIFSMVDAVIKAVMSILKCIGGIAEAVEGDVSVGTVKDCFAAIKNTIAAVKAVKAFVQSDAPALWNDVKGGVEDLCAWMANPSGSNRWRRQVGDLGPQIALHQPSQDGASGKLGRRGHADGGHDKQSAYSRQLRSSACGALNGGTCSIFPCNRGWCDTIGLDECRNAKCADGGSCNADVMCLSGVCGCGRCGGCEITAATTTTTTAATTTISPITTAATTITTTTTTTISTITTTTTTTTTISTITTTTITSSAPTIPTAITTATITTTPSATITTTTTTTATTTSATCDPGNEDCVEDLMAEPTRCSVQSPMNCPPGTRNLLLSAAELSSVENASYSFNATSIVYTAISQEDRAAAIDAAVAFTAKHYFVDSTSGVDGQPIIVNRTEAIVNGVLREGLVPVSQGNSPNGLVNSVKTTMHLQYNIIKKESETASLLHEAAVQSLLKVEFVKNVDVFNGTLDITKVVTVANSWRKTRTKLIKQRILQELLNIHHICTARPSMKCMALSDFGAALGTSYTGLDASRLEGMLNDLTYTSETDNSVHELNSVDTTFFVKKEDYPNEFAKLTHLGGTQKLNFVVAAPALPCKYVGAQVLGMKARVLMSNSCAKPVAQPEVVTVLIDKGSSSDFVDFTGSNIVHYVHQPHAFTYKYRSATCDAIGVSAATTRLLGLYGDYSVDVESLQREFDDDLESIGLIEGFEIIFNLNFVENPRMATPLYAGGPERFPYADLSKCVDPSWTSTCSANVAGNSDASRGKTTGMIVGSFCGGVALISMIFAVFWFKVAPSTKSKYAEFASGAPAAATHTFENPVATQRLDSIQLHNMPETAIITDPFESRPAPVLILRQGSDTPMLSV